MSCARSHQSLVKKMTYRLSGQYYETIFSVTIPFSKICLDLCLVDKKKSANKTREHLFCCDRKSTLLCMQRCLPTPRLPVCRLAAPAGRAHSLCLSLLFSASDLSFAIFLTLLSGVIRTQLPAWSGRPRR